MVIPLIESELSWSSCETQKTRVEKRRHQHAARKTVLSRRESVSCAEPGERTADTLLRASRLRSVREGREGSVVDRPNAATRLLSYAQPLALRFVACAG